MTADPEWHDKVAETLENTIELYSPGALTSAVGEDGHALAVAPSLFKHEDEEEGDVYSFFNLDISALAEIFDGRPHISWRTYPDSTLSLEGKVDGEDAVVHVFAHPFEDSESAGVIDKNGDLRETAPEVE